MKIGLIIALICTTTGFAQTGSEIYMANIKVTKAGVTLSNHKNITNRKGYDNQPYFHPDQTLIYFSSFNDSSRADIKYFNYKNNTTKLLTQTPEREYSPTVTPDKKFISCIIQRDNNAQDLGKYPMGGGQPIVIINNLIVGYHAWLNQTTLVLFVLGEPNALRVFDVTTGKDQFVKEKIGRSLHKIPGQNAISFVDKSEEKWLIKRYDGATIENICETLPKCEDMAWTPDGKIIMSDGRQFYYFDTKTKGGWKLFFSADVSGITRIAVDAKGKRMAFVVAEK